MDHCNLTCPACKAVGDFPDIKADKTIDCHNCGHPFDSRRPLEDGCVMADYDAAWGDLKEMTKTQLLEAKATLQNKPSLAPTSRAWDVERALKSRQ